MSECLECESSTREVAQSRSECREALADEAKLAATLRSVLRRLRALDKQLEEKSKGLYTKPSYATACADCADALSPLIREASEALGEIP